MASYVKFCKCIVILLKFVVYLGNFICVCILVDSSSKNPFDSHYIGNMTDYFYFENNTSITTSNDVKNSIIFNNKVITGENMHIESKKISSGTDNKKKEFLRKLVTKTFCSEIYDDFEKYQGTQLSNIFDLNYEKIHLISIACLFSTISTFAVGFLAVCAICCKSICSVCKGDDDEIPLSKCCFVFFYPCFVITADVINYILTIILVYYMEKGDLEKLDDFLECENVKAETFRKISDINRLRGCFFTFIILNLIATGIERMEKNVEDAEKAEEKEEKESQNIINSKEQAKLLENVDDN